MAASTSRAAALMSRFNSNCSVTCVPPSELVDVISVTAAMRPNWRSSGVATEDAMVSGLAPGRLACTLMVGKSTCGSGETGSKLYATTRHRDGDGQQGGGDGPVNEGFRDIHVAHALLRAAFTLV